MSLLTATGLALPGRLHTTALSLRGGELTCLIGPNGSGKTSLLHAVAGIGRPAGKVAIDGVDPRAFPPRERARLLAYLPASRDIAWPLSARDVIALGGGEESQALMADLDLLDIAERRVDRLSTGERSRVLIARALAATPKLLLLDEPTANLDPEWQLRLMDHVHRAIRRGRQGALVALHDLDIAARHADRLLIMDGGRIIADGDPSVLLDSPHMPAVFGVARRKGRWELASPERPRSSP